MAVHDSRPSPSALWAQAAGDGDRYRALMLEHGHLVPLKPGETAAPLPCGWPGNSRKRALARVDAAVAQFRADVEAAAGDADLIASAERAFGIALGAVDADLDAVIADLDRRSPSEPS